MHLLSVVHRCHWCMGGKTTHFREAIECRATFVPSCLLYSYVEGRDSVTDRQYPEGSTTFIIDHEFINMV